LANHSTGKSALFLKTATTARVDQASFPMCLFAQVAVEVHDVDGRGMMIEALLRKAGYNHVCVDVDEKLQAMGLDNVMVYASK
jgi:hypothetical protein